MNKKNTNLLKLNQSLLYTFYFLIVLFLQSFYAVRLFAEDSPENDQQENLTEILIKGLPFQSPIKDISTSAAVFTDKEIQDTNADHFKSLILETPNLNFAGGTARPRFFQIRGIGELEQYEVAPNPSVGFYIDGIDLSGIGGVASMFDIDQAEVLRGPQSIKYGANALAGVIGLTSKEPEKVYSGQAELSAGSDEYYQGGIAAGGPVMNTDNKLLFRVSAFHHYNDGFRDNAFLSRDDTNHREESVFRSKLKWLPDKDFTADFTFLYANANAGYDAFSIDNTYTTESDRPGRDDQGTKGGLFRLAYNLNQNTVVENISSLSKNDTIYSYDGDWGNNKFWEPFAPYDYFSETFRNRHVFTDEIRLHSRDENYAHGESAKWISGLYFHRLDEDSDINQLQDGQSYDRLFSNYTAKTMALFGQREFPVIKGYSITFGLRAEKRFTEYFDSKGGDFNPTDNMFGGNVSFNHDISENIRSYILISRGFKGGGFNANPNAPHERKQYDPEYLWNYETGIKGSWLKNRITSNLSVFYDQRKDVQVKLALQNDPSDPLSFLYLVDNASSGKNYGLESESVFKVSDNFELMANLGLLDSEYGNFEFANQNLSGREQSHAPNWQYSIGPKYNITQNFFITANVSGKDRFYFDDSNNQKSRPYHVFNIATGYKENSWALSFWVKNLFDREYPERGFYFGNEPPDFPNKQYIQLGDPRQIGTTFTYYF